MRALRLVWCGLSVAALGLTPPSAAPAVAQGAERLDPGRMHVTREELGELLEDFERASESETYSEELRARARYEADLIRQRLEEGDFQVGDQVELIVEGEPSLSSTFVVRPGKVLTLPAIGDVPMEGVMRSQLEAHLKEHLGRYIKRPMIVARTSIRVAITGEVRQPGYYVVPAESLLSDAIMVAGGPLPTGSLFDLRIERGNNRVWGGGPLQQAIVEGRTLDQMSLRAGDRIVVPAHATDRASSALRMASAFVPVILVSVTALLQLF